jgi:hypothetical protein
MDHPPAPRAPAVQVCSLPPSQGAMKGSAVLGRMGRRIGHTRLSRPPSLRVGARKPISFSTMASKNSWLYEMAW